INNGVKQWRPNLPQGSTAVTAYNSPNATGAVPAGNTYSYDNTSNTITLTTAAATLANQGIYTGMAVSGTSIPGNSIVGSLTNSTQFKIISNQTSLAAVPTPGSPIVNGSLTIGLSGAASLKQGITNSLTTGLAWSLVPIQVINGVSTGSFGNGGEASGGTIANFLKATSATTNGYCVGYISTGDAVSALKAAPGAGATPLSYEGVNIVSSYSAAAVTYDFTPIRNGTYKHWSYEHMFYNAGTLPTAQQNVANSIAQQIAGTDAALTNQCANDASIKVKRTGTHIDGSTVTPSFTNF
ncbi:MAG: hypothetical protein WCO19_05665, partial [Candidatus Saccharibacteria bacterium]